MIFSGAVKLPKEYNNGVSIIIDINEFWTDNEESAREITIEYIQNNHKDINIKDCIIILKEIEE